MVQWCSDQGVGICVGVNSQGNEWRVKREMTRMSVLHGHWSGGRGGARR